MQILVDLAAQFDRQVAFVGRGVIDNSEIAQRLGYLRIPAGVQIRDSDVRELPGAGRGVHLHRVAGRAAGGAAAHRHRRSPPRQAGPGRRGGVLGARDPGQREGDRPGDEPRRPPRRRRDPRGHASTSTSRGTAARKSSSSCFRWSGRATSCRYTGSTASSPGTRGWRRECPRRPRSLLAENGDVIRFDDDGGRVAERGAGRPDADRRHPQRRGRRRGAARPPAPVRRRAGRAGRGHRPAVRQRSRRRRTSSPAGSCSMRARRRC